MSEPERIDFKKVIEEIENNGKSLYYIAKLMNRTYTQIKRMKQGGTVAHYEGEMLLLILDDCKKVSCET